jgi:hypothetical protein
MAMDLFGHEADPQHTGPLVGLIVDLQQQCKCGAYVAVIGPSKGLHSASLRCQSCGEHRGWLSRQTHRFLTKTTEQFGRPTDPIKYVVLPNPRTMPAVIGIAATDKDYSHG